MAITPLEDGSDRSIDARSIVVLIAFFIVNILVIWPISIPLPLSFSRYYHKITPNSSPTPATKSEKKVDEKSTVPATANDVVESGSSSGQLVNSTSASTSSGTIDQARLTAVPSKERPTSTPTGTNERLSIPLDLRTAPVIGVLILLASTCIPGSVVRSGIVGSGGVRPYDIMTLFLSFAYISLSLDATGVLRYLAFLVASRSTSKGGGITLYNSFYLFFTIIGLLFGNDPLILSGTPFLAYFTEHASISPPTAYLFTHFQVSNLVSALLVSSNPTNLVLTSAFGISFLSFSAWLALPTVAAVIVLYPILKFGVFKSQKMIPYTIYPPKINPREALLDPFGAIFGATIFVVVVVVLVTLSALKLLEGTEGVWTVTAPAAVIVLIRDLWADWRRSSSSRGNTSAPPAVAFAEGVNVPAMDSSSDNTATPAPTPTSSRKEKPSTSLSKRKHRGPIAIFTRRFPTTSLVISRLPFPLLPFAFSFFILVEGLQHTGWIRVFGGWWGAWERVGGVAGSVALMGILSVIGCNVFGTNIGATILLSRVIQYWATTTTSPTVSDRSLYGAVFALAVGSNFGAYSFVFSASLAGLLWRNILSQKGLRVTMKEFIKYNTVPVVITMIVGCLVVAGEVCVIYKS